MAATAPPPPPMNPNPPVLSPQAVYQPAPPSPTPVMTQVGKTIGATSGKAMAAMWLSFATFAFLVPGIGAIYLARQAKKDIRESGGLVGGNGLATAAIVVSTVGFIFWGLFLVFGFLSLILIASSAGHG